MAHPILEEIYARREVVDADGKRYKLHAEITRDEGELLAALVERHGCSRTLEIGCAFGLSSLWICEALSRRPAPRHTILDPFQHTDWHGIGVHNLKRAGYDFFELLEQPSELALPAFLAANRAFQLILIDGVHTFDHALVDFFYANRLLETGGVVVLDDLQLPGIGRLARYIANYPNYRVCGAAKTSIVAPSLKRKLCEAPLRALARLVPRAVAERTFTAAFFRHETTLGLTSEMVAFEKTGPDQRDIHWYAPF